MLATRPRIQPTPPPSSQGESLPLETYSLGQRWTLWLLRPTPLAHWVRRGLRGVFAVLGGIREVLPFYHTLYHWVFSRHLPSDTVIEGTYTIRSGACNGCGECCQSLYLTYRRLLLQTEAEFEALKQLHPSEYAGFAPIGYGNKGLLFNCVHLQADKRCGIYEHRPGFCRTYPTEDSILTGGKLPAECSYIFTMKQTFASILEGLGDADGGDVHRHPL
ncbi:MAG: YkgJ family cysteine cluster protein [Vampirovibrionales bacterium]